MMAAVLLPVFIQSFGSGIAHKQSQQLQGAAVLLG